MLREEGYKPRILAVDEFAIHKGHSYATCVMDLEQGDILCALRLLIGRHHGSDGHERILQQACNKARIVYDRFHMQSQFGRDVLGAVRLDEARRLQQQDQGC